MHIDIAKISKQNKERKESIFVAKNEWQNIALWIIQQRFEFVWILAIKEENTIYYRSSGNAVIWKEVESYSEIIENILFSG